MFCSKEKFLLIAPLVIGSILVSILFLVVFSGNDTNFDDMALGKNTISVFANNGDYPIHCKDVKDAENCIDGYRYRGHHKAIIWLGNSQVHAINQFRAGQENAPPILHRKLLQHHYDLLTFSQPNANLQEHYILFEYLKRKLSVEMLLLPIVFDDLREDGIRATISPALSDIDVISELKSTIIGKSILARQDDQSALSSDLAALKQTIQEKSEKSLNRWLDNNVDLWKMRPEIRGQLFNKLYQTRNFIFGIDPASKRRIIRSRYSANLDALRSIIKSADEAEIKVLLYIVPLRNDIDIPYDEKEYITFKQHIADLVKSTNVKFMDLENLVPGKLWGVKDATNIGDNQELDYMHFQAPGHVTLSEALYQSVLSIITQEAHQ